MVSEAQELTGKSERTIRRFLKANVNANPDHFEMKTKSGREVWLIATDFLKSHYPFVNAGENDTELSRDNAGGNASGGRGLQKEWQQSKQNSSGKETNTSEESTGAATARHDSDTDSGDTAELWKLIHAQQEEIKKKDEQLDRYFTTQQEMMTTLGLSLIHI